MKRYSQNDEQDVILRFFEGRTCRFLDIGAFDGVELSNTRALAEIGWTGLMVEPNPYNLVPLLESVWEFNGRVDVWAAAVSSCPSHSVLRLDETPGRGWASSISSANPGVLAPSPVRLVVPTVTPAALLNHGPFQFISIDAEWKDEEILAALPRPLDGCELICIEPADLEMRERMKCCLVDDFGFTIHHETPENIMACKRS